MLYKRFDCIVEEYKERVSLFGEETINEYIGITYKSIAASGKIEKHLLRLLDGYEPTLFCGFNFCNDDARFIADLKLKYQEKLSRFYDEGHCSLHF